MNSISMASGTAGENGLDDIREGLICPICLQDQGTVDQLVFHFDSAHNTDEEKDILQSVKGWLSSLLMRRSTV